MRSNRNLNRSLIIALLTLTLIACGGGSSGTGESENAGQIVDQECNPVANADLNQLGIGGVSGNSEADGTFTFAPSPEETITVPTDGEAPTSVDVAQPTCVLLVESEGKIDEFLSYPQDALESCSVASVAIAFPGDLEGFCGNKEVEMR